MPAKAILHFVSLLMLHLEFVIKKTCPSDFYLIGFPFFGDLLYFYSSFRFRHVDVHEPLEAQQAIVTPLEVFVVAQGFLTGGKFSPFASVMFLPPGGKFYRSRG